MSSSAFFGSEGIGQDSALAGLQPSAGRALADAEDDQQSQGVGEAATERENGESGDATHVEPLAANAVGDPAADGQHDGVRDQIGGQNPGGFVVTGAERPGDMRQRYVGDGGIERLHEGRQRHREGDDPRIEPRFPRLIKMKFTVGVPRFHRRVSG